jgi:PAS domain S-box-containing protein
LIFELLRGETARLGKIAEKFDPQQLSDVARSLFASASIGIWFYDAESETLYADDVTHVNLGRPPETLQTVQSWTELIHPEDLPRLAERQIAHAYAEQIEPIVFRIIRPDGEIRFIRSWSMASYDEKGKISFIVGLDRDITETERLAAEAATNDRRFQSLTENVPGTIFRYVLHPDGSDDVEYISQGCQEIYEISAEELKEDPSRLWSIVLADDSEALQKSVMESAANLSTWHHRWRIQVQSGRIKHLEGRGSPESQKDGSIVWNSLILDVSDEVALSEELLNQQAILARAQKMESIGRISGGIAHDFNNLLAVISGNAELIGGARSEEERNSYINEILSACRRGSKLTYDLLTFARRSHLEPKVVGVDSVLLDMGEMLKRALTNSIDTQISADPDLWLANIDRSFFENAMLNLCINARDAMPNGGRLIIEARNINISEFELKEKGEGVEAGRYVMVSVTDTGSGIPEAVLERILEPFFSTKDPDKGSGLGLAMVDGFVRQSSGFLRIYSEQGRGTSIKMFLPAHVGRVQTASDDLAAPVAEKKEKQSGRILVVEDEAAILRVISIILGKAGYDISTASSGDEALKLYSNDLDSFDLLLTDIVMPGELQGPALAQTLKQGAPDLKVLFMSGFPKEAAVQGYALLSADRLLVKPVLRDELLRAVRAALDARGS